MSLDTNLLIMELDRPILKCMPAYLELRELFDIVAHHFDFIIGLSEQLLFYWQTSL